jgi:hypothetical protein
MSVFRRQGLVRKPGGLLYFLGQQLKLVDLRPVKRITYKFDPFHPNTKDFRALMFHMSSLKVRETNYNCTFKTEVLSDMSEPLMLCKLENGTQIKFEASNLTNLEILEALNRITHPLLPPPEDLTVEAPKTKSQKKKK